MPALKVGDRVTHKRNPARGEGTVRDFDCGWPRCPFADCVTVLWDRYFPYMPTNSDASELTRV